MTMTVNVHMTICYECSKPAAELSKRSRCVHCEYRRGLVNEAELEKLGAKIEELHEVNVLLGTEQEWVSVKSRFPEDRSEVLCVNKDGRQFKCMGQGRGFKVDCTVWECSNVTHWMPLPAGPQA